MALNLQRNGNYKIKKEQNMITVYSSFLLIDIICYCDRSSAVEDEPRKRRDVENTEPSTKSDTRVTAPPASEPKTREKSKISILETMVRVLTESLEEAKTKQISNVTCQPIQDMVWTPSDIFMDKWVNFTGKYGLFYSLTDNTRGVFFTDSTTLLTKNNE